MPLDPGSIPGGSTEEMQARAASPGLFSYPVNTPVDVAKDESGRAGVAPPGDWLLPRGVDDQDVDFGPAGDVGGHRAQ